MGKAIIVGCKGQDGRITTEYLSNRDYKILGIDIDTIETHGIDWNEKVDSGDPNDVFDLICEIKPDEVYYYAAYHHSSEDMPIEDYDFFDRSYRVHVLSLLNFLEAIRKCSTATRLFYAPSSLIFGETDTEVQDENTPFNPNTVYGITKLDGLLICRLYRVKYNVFASMGICYNHESVYREDRFITKKIIKGALNIKYKKQDKIIIGDINAEVDWGYANDYIDAFYRILNIQAPDEFIVATGVKHSVLDFVKIAFAYLGLEWGGYVYEDKSIITRERKTLIGNL